MITRQSLPPYVNRVIDDLKNEEPIESIWLVGSRANGKEKESSDWDILAFSGNKPCVTKQHHKNIDIIIVGPSKKILLEGQSIESMNSFSSWSWPEKHDRTATYVGRKFIKYPSGIRNISDPVYEESTNDAYCLWSKSHDQA
jgi:hypothetical protein